MAATSEVIEGYRLRGLLHNAPAGSQVYEVVEVRSNRHFAMKILLPEAAAAAGIGYVDLCARIIELSRARTEGSRR